MNLRSLLLLFALSSSLYAAPPPELAPLQQQWGNAVTTPHETALADLNTKFTAALGNAVTAAKQAGKLDEVLAIQEDQKRLAQNLPLPDNTDTTPESLKKLRGIYRDQLAKLNAQRTANHTALLPAYTAKLKELEATLTKADRIEEAKEVMSYREALAAGNAAVAAITPQAMKADEKAAQAPVPVDNGPTVSAEDASRQLVEWGVQNGHGSTVKTKKGEVTITTAADIPKETFDLIKLRALDGLKFEAEPPWRMFQFTPNVDYIWLDFGKNKPELTPHKVASFRNLNKINSLELANFGPSDMMPVIEAMPPLPSLRNMVFQPDYAIPSGGLAKLVAKYPELRGLSFYATSEVSDEEFTELASHKKLEAIRFDGLKWTFSPVKVAALAKMPALKRLSMFAIQTVPLDEAGAKLLTNINEFGVNYECPPEALRIFSFMPALEIINLRRANTIADADLQSLSPSLKLKSLIIDECQKLTDQTITHVVSRYPDLEKLRLAKCEGITEQGYLALSGLKKLIGLNLSNNPAVTDAILPVLQDLKKLKELNLKGTAVTEAALAAFKRKRGDINLAK
jgi:hypothetical protein